jgi:hypothetical protein
MNFASDSGLTVAITKKIPAGAGSVPWEKPWENRKPIIGSYLVAHPTNRKWVITPVINGIFVGLIHL